MPSQSFGVHTVRPKTGYDLSMMRLRCAFAAAITWALSAPAGAAGLLTFEKEKFSLAEGAVLIAGGTGPCTYEINDGHGAQIAKFSLKPGRVRWNLQAGTPKTYLRAGTYTVVPGCSGPDAQPFQFSLAYHLPGEALPANPEIREKAWHSAEWWTIGFVAAGVVAGLGAGVGTWATLKRQYTPETFATPPLITPFLFDGFLGGAATGLAIGIPVSFFVYRHAMHGAAGSPRVEDVPAAQRSKIEVQLRVVPLPR